MKTNPKNAMSLVALAVAPVLYFFYRKDIYEVEKKYLGLQTNSKSRDDAKKDQSVKSNTQTKEE